MGLSPCERMISSSAGVRVAVHGWVPARAPSSRVCTPDGRSPELMKRTNSAWRRSLAARAASVSALGGLRKSKRPTPCPAPRSARHEGGERLAQRLRVLADLLGLLRQAHEPFGRIDILGVERDAAHYHCDGGLK